MGCWRLHLRGLGLPLPAATRIRTCTTKAAALLHSLAKNHALVDGNKRLALAAAIAFLGINGERLRMSQDEAYELVTAVAAGEIDELQQIADRLQ